MDWIKLESGIIVDVKGNVDFPKDTMVVTYKEIIAELVQFIIREINAKD